jgi:hypothetical protein
MKPWRKGSPIATARRTSQQRADFQELEIKEGLALTALRDNNTTTNDIDTLRNMAGLAAVLNPNLYTLARQVFHEPAYPAASKLWRLTCADRRCISVAQFDAAYSLLMGQPPNR